MKYSQTLLRLVGIPSVDQYLIKLYSPQSHFVEAHIYTSDNNLRLWFSKKDRSGIGQFDPYYVTENNAFDILQNLPLSDFEKAMLGV